MIYDIGEEVICGEVDMSRFMLDGRREKRWFTGEKGTIIGITDHGHTVRLAVDAGKKFKVQITKKSLTEMNLNVGSEVYLTFKASSVRLI